MIQSGEVADQTAFMRDNLDYLFNKQPDFLLWLKEQKFDMLIVERYEDQ